jgi:hypothetical protein
LHLEADEAGRGGDGLDLAAAVERFAHGHEGRTLRLEDQGERALAQLGMPVSLGPAATLGLEPAAPLLQRLEPQPRLEDVVGANPTGFRA